MQMVEDLFCYYWWMGTYLCAKLEMEFLLLIFVHVKGNEREGRAGREEGNRWKINCEEQRTIGRIIAKVSTTNLER
jgi:hypothetical protein